MKKNKFFSLNLPDKVFGIEKSLLMFFLPPLCLIVLFFIILNLVLVPKINEIGEIKNKINEVKANTDKIKAQNKYLMSIDQEELKRDAEYLDNAVLKDKKSYLLVEIIRGVADDFGYQIESFSLTPGELKEEEEESSIKISASNDTVKMPINLTMIGPKEKTLELISALEKTLPILFIDKFETKNSGGLTQLNLTVSSYYVNDKSNIETENITLDDLILSKEESALITRISSFNKIENNQVDTGNSEFKKYIRENPFSL
ncbi:MAG: hypothetical protein PHE32_01650 [Candidatus Shapirobacteria bacterium]|nr:hypothetical protein [Candidatus Shapirobacteria bacterium]MDD4410392.1 hypothetical protein [Candidatus Shapirobacteria bacterium]